MTRIVLILLIALVFEAIGVVLLSSGLKQVGLEGKSISVDVVLQMIKHGATNHKILLGVLFEAIFFAALCYLLASQDVSLIWPLTSLGFVITALSAKFFLHEQVSWIRWLGICLIVAGAAVTTYSEKLKERQQKAEAATSVQSDAR